MSNTRQETRKSVEAIYPLSPTQEGILLHTLGAPDSGVYVTQVVCALERPDAPAFESAWRRVVGRHPVLRTAFAWRNVEKPLQVVGRSATPVWDRQDWRALSPPDQAERLEAYLDADRRQGFRLEKAPLMRFALLRLGDDSYKFVWSHQHLLLDGWSVFLVLGEVLAYYDAFARGGDLELPLPRPYGDYIAWLQRQDLSRAESFWRRALAGFDSPTDIRPDRAPAPASGPPRYDKQQLTLSEQETAALQASARRHHLTVNTLVQGAWALLLSRYAGARDVVFGATVSGRPAELAGAERMVGLFINTLPVRARTEGREVLSEWLRGLQAEQAEARAYEYSPLARVQAWAGAGRGRALFDTLFVFENYPVDSSLKQQGRGLVVTEAYAVEQTNYPLTVLVTPGRELRLQISHEQRYEARTVKRLLEHMSALLVAMAADPDQRLEDLPLLSEGERRRVLGEWNATDADYERLCVHELCERQAARTPDAPALSFEGQSLTYRELDARANQLARLLRRRGVGPEVLVAVVMERSIEMVVSLLAIMKAGGAYVPIDPDYPAERVNFITDETGARVVLTQGRVAERTGGLWAENLRGRGVATIKVDAEWDEIARESAERVEGGVGPDKLAYVIYTSGSTGRPKGAMNTHAGVSNRLQWMQDEYRMGPGERVLQKTPYTFDVSAWEFFWPLTCGAELVVARPGGHRDAAYLRDVIAEREITTVHFVPSLLTVFLEEDDLERRCKSLRRVICSGEALAPSLADRFFARFAEAELHNLYGPTEAAIDVTAWRCERDGLRASVPIGRPISNIRLYVLDEQTRPVPVGAVGELYIGGVGVGRGYLNRPELTAEKFLPDLFGQSGGGRLYRSGDVVRRLDDGALEYLGRADEQVKVRGNRVELGEIEAVLREHARVREAAVKAWGGAGDPQRLVGYVVCKAGVGASGEELRDYVRGRLPDYMVPAHVEVLTEMPLTASGKINRRELPEVKIAGRADDARRVGPRTPVEEVLAGIWGRVLGVEEVGVHDNFFDLGGDSIQSIRVRAQAQKVGLDFSLEQLLRCNTVAALAREIGVGEQTGPPPTKTEPFGLLRDEDRRRVPAHVEDAYPLAALQAGMLFHSKLTAGAATYHDVFSAHLEAPFEPRAFQEAAVRLAARHPVLRTSFDLTGFAEPLQLVHKAAALPVHFDDLRGLADDEQERALSSWKADERRRSFDWASPPLVHFYVHQRTDASFQFTVSFHHAVLDGWSVAVMVSEFFAAYLGLVGGGEAAGQPAPAATYRDFVALERATLQSAEAEQFWDRQLAGAHVTAVAGWAGGDAAAQAGPETGVVSARIPAEVSEGLMRLVRSTGVPLKSVLLAAHLRALKLLSGQADVVTGLVSNGRPEVADGDRVLGLFLNTVPFRLRLEGGTWKELVTQTFRAERESFPHRRYPLAELQRKRGRQALFQALFNYNNFHIYKSLEGQIKVLSQDAFEETNFPLVANFSSAAAAQNLTLNLHHDSSIFPARQARAIADYYQTILSEMALNPSAPYQHKSLLPAREQAQLLGEWNATDADYERACAHELFERQCDRAPDAPALSSGDQSLTYRELDDRANQLAQRLRRRGVGPEVLVGVMMERSIEMVVALLAVLKAGGAYVPIDPAYPAERSEFIVEETGARLILTQGRVAERMDARWAERLAARGVASISVGALGEELARESAERIQSGVGPDDLAYVIYTSGSTGRPKGVAVTHGNLCHSTAARMAYYGAAPARFLLTSPFAFDSSVAGIFWTLCYGGTLFLPEEGVQRDVKRIAELIAENDISHLLTLPSVHAALIEHLRPARPGPSTTFIVAGESCPQELVARHHEALPRASLFNEYGPTENTVWSTAYRARPGDRRAPVPIGRPVANARVYLLDAELTPAPLGYPGEIYVGGDGLARGYLNRPDLTAERFVPDPFSRRAGARLYRTGDVGRYREDAEIEFLGRNDQQVKVRGYRIELQEIEAALRRDESVREAAVLARDDGEGGKRLVAYVGLREGAARGADELRASLRELLPDYMIPTAFVLLDALPQMPNGKVDRAALPAPGESELGVRAHYAPPATEAERRVAAVWEETLRVERVGRDDNFFDMGGHSLLLLRVNSRLRELFDQDLPMVEMFQYPTVRLLAERLSRGAGAPPPAASAEELSEKRRQGRSRLQNQLKQRRRAGS